MGGRRVQRRLDRRRRRRSLRLGLGVTVALGLLVLAGVWYLDRPVPEGEPALGLFSRTPQGASSLSPITSAGGRSCWCFT